MNAPLADRIRPETLDEVVGQQHILGPNKVLRRIIESGTIPNMVFLRAVRRRENHRGVHHCKAKPHAPVQV